MKRFLWLPSLLILTGPVLLGQLREIPLPFPDTTRFKVQFIDKDNGWVSSMNGSILRTTDGGLSWEEYRSPYPKPLIDEIKFSTKEYGILWADSSRGNYRGRLYETFSAGKDWQIVPTLDSIFIYYNQELSKQPYQYDLYTHGHGNIIYSGGREWKIGGDRKSERSTAWTTNSGTDWNVSRYPIGTFPDVFIPLDSNRWGWFSASPEIPNISPQAMFQISTDRGATWTMKGYWRPMLGLNCEFRDSRTGIIFTSNWSEGWSYGAFVTTDGGESWEEWDIVGAYTGVLIRDSVIYTVAHTRFHSWDVRPHGSLVRIVNPRMDQRKVIIENTVTCISSVGTTVYALTLEGKLYVIDELLGTDKPPAPADHALRITPNPARDRVYLVREGPAERVLSVALYNAAGVRILRDINMNFQRGETHKTISLDNLPSGIYFLVERGEKTAVHPISLIR